MKLVHVVGARPNFVKLAPVVRAIAASEPAATQVIVHTGQHYDAGLSQVLIDELGFPTPDHLLAIGSGSHAEQTARVLERLEPILLREQPDLVVVAGDVNSTLAAALTAAKLGIPVAHVEAGLRSFDRTMPEEINRVLTDQISRWCFTHSPEAVDNLRREGIDPDRIHQVGNTMIDTLVRMRPASARSTVHARLGLDPGAYVVVTLHRPGLVDGSLLEPALAGLARLGTRLPVVFPVHPRTRAQLGSRSPAGLTMIEPLGYVDFLALQARALAVVTDSGGVQEETTYLRVPCFTLRSTTDRPVTIAQGTNRLLGLDFEQIEAIPELVEQLAMPASAPEGWDGKAADRLASVLLSPWAEQPRPSSR